MEILNESVSNDSGDGHLYQRDDQQRGSQPNLTNNGFDKNVILEKFIVLCRSRLNDSPNRRKKRYSGLRKSVAQYYSSNHWNKATFENLIRQFSGQLEADTIDHEKADAIYRDMMKELASLTGRTVSCSGKCRKRKKKARKETTLCKLEKSLGVIQRRINRMKDESSSNAWEARDGRDGRYLKLLGMQKKALRLTKKINELSKLAAANSVTNLSSPKIENVDEASGSGDAVSASSSSGFNSNSDMDELNCLLKSVRLKESVKLKPKVVCKLKPGHFGNIKPSEYRSIYPRIRMVEIKKFDQQNQCYVESSSTEVNRTSSKPMPFKIIRQKGANVSNSPLSSSYQKSSPSSPSNVNPAVDLKSVKNKSPTKKRSEIHNSRKQSTFDLICDRFRHVTLNS